MDRSIIRAVVASFAAVSLIQCGESSPGTPSGASTGPTPVVNSGTPLPTANILIPPPGSIYLGVYVNPTQLTPPPISELDDYQATVGRNFAISMHYYSFYDTFPTPDEQDDVANGRIPLESWNCQPSDAAVASGSQDGTIRQVADNLKAFGHPIFLRYMWEMNLPATETFRNPCYDPNTDLTNGQFSPPQYIAAWTHIRAIFSQEGVTNVIWLWNPSGTVNPLAYYPGPSEVDWVGVDKYDIDNETFQENYALSYSWLLHLGKPIIIGETGANASVQVPFFQSAVSTLETSYPNIRAFMYFDSMKEGALNSWVIPSSNLPAFTAMALDPYFSAMEPGASSTPANPPPPSSSPTATP